MKITATIQARMGSSRLPGKVLKKIYNKPLLEWQIDRIKKCVLIDEILVATTINSNDQAIIDFCNLKKIKYWAGSEKDVLSRVNNAFNSTNSEVHVEFYGDSPFIDPLLIDRYIGFFLKNYNQIDLLTNTIKTTFPPGNEFVIYKKKCLNFAQNNTDQEDPLREHVSVNIINKNVFKTLNIEAKGIYNKPNLYLEIDSPEDFQMLEKLIPIVIKDRGIDFSLKDIINISNRERTLSLSNTKVERKWKKFRED